MSSVPSDGVPADLIQAKATIAERIVDAMEERHLTVRQAAEMSGVAAADFSRIRNANIERFTLDRLIKILAGIDAHANVRIHASVASDRALQSSQLNTIAAPSLDDHIARLRTLLFTHLCPTDHRGFEGLMSTVLGKISHVQFRLSGSGSQHGIDGRSAAGDRHISFECKLYTTKIKSSEVHSKIGELSSREDSTDLWVLCSTRPINEQIATSVAEFGRKASTSTLVLDWQSSSLPLLAVALAIAAEETIQFFKREFEYDGSDLSNALRAIARDSRYGNLAEQLSIDLAAPTIGVAAAMRANEDWLNTVFRDRSQAMQRLGQPLSPADPGEHQRHREDLVSQVAHLLSGKPTSVPMFLLGEEGTGKSWIAAQAWLLEVGKRPLTVIMTPSMFADTVGETNIDETLISALIVQTSEHTSNDLVAKWQRIFKSWRRNPTAQVRLVAIVDGINQRPKKDWARILEKLSSDLYSIGGRLIVTVRTSYQNSNIRNRIDCLYEELHIPEWADTERDSILSEKGVQVSSIASDLARALCNPRILGIAIKLWSQANLVDVQELTVSRLLFEHIRTCVRDDPRNQTIDEVVRDIREHASEVVGRVSNRDFDDMAVFDRELESVVEGRFFRHVDGDATRYQIVGEGLPLALAFLAIDRVRMAKRNGRDPLDSLEAIVEPIAALDLTSEVVVAAVTITCVAENDSRISVALIRWFASVQNVREESWEQLVSIVRSRPEVFGTAVYELCTFGGHQPNMDLIRRAMIAASKSQSVWNSIRDLLARWLSYYSLWPRLRPRPVRSAADWARDRRQKHSEAKAEYVKKVETMSSIELRYIEDLEEVDCDLGALWRFALGILVGRKRAPEVGIILRWAFSIELSPEFFVCYRELFRFLRFNCIDWCRSRELLLKDCDVLRSSGISPTGRMVVARILQATGDASDEAEAQTQIEWVFGQREEAMQWRLVENYCPVDPCDPASKKPRIMTKTAEAYSKIQFDGVRQNGGRTRDGLFFDMARPAMARFARSVAVVKHREYIDSVIRQIDGRSFPRVSELREHNALLLNRQLSSLVRKVKDIGFGEGLSDDRWVTSQYCLLLVLPFLDGKEQLDLIGASDKEPILSLVDLVSPVAVRTIVTRANKAMRQGSRSEVFACFVSAGAIRGVPSITLGDMARSAIVCKSGMIRAQAMSLIVRLEDRDLLSLIVDSGWNALSACRYDEKCYGSEALILAAGRGLIPYRDAARRISPLFYGEAAARWDQDGREHIARAMDGSIRSACRLEFGFERPIEVEVDDRRRRLRPMATPSAESLLDSGRPGLGWVGMSDEELNLKLKELNAEFKLFEQGVRNEGCDVILDHIGLEEFVAIARTDSRLLNEWCELLLSLSADNIRVMYNVVCLVAHAVGFIDPEMTERLFNMVEGVEPRVSVKYGYSEVDLYSLAAWKGGESGRLDEVRVQRLERASNDHQLSQEVLAAQLGGRKGLLMEYIEARLRMAEPSRKARAFTVAGFLDRNELSDRLLEEYDYKGGFLGVALKHAQYAYERNVWARHWFRKMCRAGSAETFWGASVLFLKVVDGRYDVWRDEYRNLQVQAKRLLPNMQNVTANRVKKWKGRRLHRLFGDDAPPHWFVRGSGRRDA